jgi:hypothetical protein
MGKKYELLKITNVLSEDIEINIIANFISKLTMQMDLNKYYTSCEFTLFLYNCIINSNLKINKQNEIKYLIKLYELIFISDKLSEEHILKIKTDLEYIKMRKLFTKINFIYYYANLTYTFFFCPHIYLIEK